MNSLEGTTLEYYSNGKLKSKSQYIDDVLLESEKWTIDGTLID